MSKAEVADPTKIVKNNTAWSGALTFTFLTSTPDYYPEDYVSGKGKIDRSNPSLIHTYRVTVTLAITPKLRQTQLCLGGRAHGRRGSAGSGSGWTLNCCALSPLPDG
jgi:hypothetical protein